MLKSLTVFSAFIALSTSTPTTLLLESIASRIIHRDVAIIGAGASGAYAAIRLKEDYHKSIIVVEKAAKLGGHVSTYDDPATNQPYNFGVQSFNDYGPAAAFFERMNVTTGSMPRVPLTNRYVDFTTGDEVPFTPPANDARAAALQKFLDVVAPFESFMLPGYFNFPPPNEIPADLLLPFHEFVAKYDIEAAVNQVFQVTGFGMGDMMNELTFWVVGAFGAPMLRTFLGQAGMFTPSSKRNIELYEKIATRLGSDVLYSSIVAQSIRTKFGTTLWVKGPDGKYTLIIAKRILIAIEPTPENMAPFSLDSTESSVFSKFRFTNSYAGIVTHPSLPVDVALVNTPESAAPNNWLALPEVPFTIRFDHMGAPSTNWRVVLMGDTSFTESAAKQLVQANFQTFINGGIVPPAGGVPLTFKAWSNHGSMHARVSAAELRAGFIQKLYALQGRRGTWWTGGAWSVQFQSVLWAFDDVILPKLVAEL